MYPQGCFDVTECVFFSFQTIDQDGLLDKYWRENSFLEARVRLRILCYLTDAF